MKNFCRVTAIFSVLVAAISSPIEASEEECDLDTVIAKNNECLSKYPDSSCSYMQCMDGFVTQWDYDNCKKQLSDEDMAKLDEVYNVYNEKDTECRADDEAGTKVCDPRDVTNISGQCSSRYEGCEYVNCTFIPSDEYLQDCKLKYDNKDIDEDDYNWIIEYTNNIKIQNEECNGTGENSEEDTNTGDNTSDNTSDNTTDNTGDNTSDNTGDNTTDNTGDNTGDNNNENSDDDNECSAKDLRNISGQCSSRYDGCKYIACTYIPSDDYMKDCEEKHNNNEIDDDDYNWILQYTENVKQQEKECDASGENSDDGTTTNDNTGDNTGDNTSDNTGDNTGDNTSDNTSDNTGDNTGDNNNENSDDDNECSAKDLRNISGQCSSRYDGCKYIACTYIPSDNYMKDCEEKHNNNEIDDDDYNWILQYTENVKQQEKECNTTGENAESSDEDTNVVDNTSNDNTTDNTSNTNDNASANNDTDTNDNSTDATNNAQSNNNKKIINNTSLNGNSTDTSDATKLTFSLLAVVAVVFNVMF